MTDTELVNLETEMMKLLARSEGLTMQAEGVDKRIDELQTEIVNTPAHTPLGALVKIRLCVEVQDIFVGETDMPIWMDLLRSAYRDLQGA